jgi:signal transduction histidine kinase
MKARLGRLRGARGTVRLRLTALYGGLFLACGAAVLAITFVLVQQAISNSSFNFYQSADGSLSGTGTGAPDDDRIIHDRGQNPLTPSQTEALADQLSELAAADRAHTLQQLLINSGIALAIMTIVAIALGWIVAGRVLRPLRTISDTTRRISEQNLHERLALTGPRDELTTLGDTIDDLLSRLEAAFDAQRRFVANASHELRTPLTMMRTALDVATAKPDPVPPEVTTLARKMTIGLDKADRLVESFLALARAQHQPSGRADDRPAIALDELVGRALAERQQDISRRRLSIVRDGHGAVVGVDPVLAGHLVDNLIDNAIRHNEPGGWISVVAGRDDDSGTLVVENGGRVLSTRDVDELARPFRRLSPDRTSSEGVGLGLSIVAAIVDACDGSLDLDARPEGGLRVTVTLPAPAPSETSADRAVPVGSAT